MQIHPETEEYIPWLAKQWTIETDEGAGVQTYTFRLDEHATFSDGQPVRAVDVVASFKHKTLKDRQHPSSYILYREGFEDPIVLDERTVKVRTKSNNWQLFLRFAADMNILPARHATIPGDEYLSKYNWTMIPGSGPYSVRSNGVVRGESVTLERRDDWWAARERWAVGCYNFKEVLFRVIRGGNLEFEMFKKGDLDYYYVSSAERWVRQLPKEGIVTRGWVKMRKVFTHAPVSFSGIVFNLRRAPFSNRNIRLAFAHLFNRERLVSKLFHGQYQLMKSYFPGGRWGNGDRNEVVAFDPLEAEMLLAEAGYTRRDREGVLIDGSGSRLEVTLLYGYQSWEKIWLVMKNDFEKAGVKFILKLIDPSTLAKMVAERQFEVCYYVGGGSRLPDPERQWRSDLAQKPGSANVPGLALDAVDSLCAEYVNSPVRDEQRRIIRELDELLYNAHPYALGWFAGYVRFAFWDRFGHPPSLLTRTGEILPTMMIRTWWFDDDAERRLQRAMADETALPQGETEVRPWE